MFRKFLFLLLLSSSILVVSFSEKLYSQQANSYPQNELTGEFKDLVSEANKLMGGLMDDINSDEKIIAERARKDLLNKIVPYNASIITLATKIFEDQGINHMILDTDFGFQPETQAIVYVYILPYGNHYLNRFSSFLDEMGVMLAYTPQLLILERSGACFMSNERILSVSHNVVAAEYKDKRTTIHELLHSLFNSMEKMGIESDFGADLTFPKSTDLGKRYGEAYSKYLSLEEMATYAENVAYGSRAVKREYNKIMALLTTSFIRLEKIVGDHVYKNIVPNTQDVEEKKTYIKKYRMFIDLVESIFVSHNKNDKRHQKIVDLLDQIFDENAQDFKNEVLDIMESLYSGEFKIYTDDPSVIRNREDVFSELNKEIKSHIYSLNLLAKVSKKAKSSLEYIIQKVEEPKFYYEAGTDYYSNKLDEEGQKVFDSKRPVRYFGEDSDVRIDPKTMTVSSTGLTYTDVVCEIGSYSDPFSYHTIISGTFDSQKGLIEAFISKLNRQLKMADQFVVNSGTLIKMIQASPVYQNAESFSILEQEGAIAKIIKFSEEIRQFYVDNISLSGEKWPEIIRAYKKVNASKKSRSINLNDQNWNELKNIDPNIRGENVKKGIISMMAVVIGDDYSPQIKEAELVELFGNFIIAEADEVGSIPLIAKTLLASPDFYTYLEGVEGLDPQSAKVFITVLKPAFLSHRVKPSPGGDVKGISVITRSTSVIEISKNNAMIEAYKNSRGNKLKIRPVGR